MSKNLDLFAIEGRRRRDVGIKRVIDAASAAWTLSVQTHADTFLDNLPRGGEFTGETVRLYCEGRSVGEPHHPNAWGAVLRGVYGRWRKAKRITTVGVAVAHLHSSHARMMPRYRKEQ